VILLKLLIAVMSRPFRWTALLLQVSDWEILTVRKSSGERPGVIFLDRGTTY
tara:strand:+ start:434 stop:589 length:156 start_codon:yes stop_codon:yes gene_type:complete